MRVLFSSMRMTGHVRPLLPYAIAARDRGHDVLFAAPESAGAMLRDAGIAHAVFGHPGDEQLGRVWASVANLPLEKMVDTFVGKIFADLNARAALPGLQQTLQSWKPDLIVRETMEFGSAIAAAQTGIPFANIATTNGHAEATALGRATASLDGLRREAGLAPDEGASLRAAPVFTSFPPSIDGDAAADGFATPFRVRSPRDTVDPDRPVPAWARDDGRPLIFITFGTLAAGSAKNHDLFRAALEAAAGLPVRALLSTGAEMDSALLGAIPGNVTVESWVHQRDVFPRAAALVCHGGAGTILAGLSHGVPMVLAPLTADQPDSARRVEAAGAGIALFHPDMPSLRAAMERVLGDAQMRPAAVRIAAEMAAMPTMDDAVSELQRLAAG